MDPDALAATRDRLLAELTLIAHDAALSARTRCPYRGVDDACAFTAGCRNRLPGGDDNRCGGGLLNPEPA